MQNKECLYILYVIVYSVCKENSEFFNNSLLLENSGFFLHTLCIFAGIITKEDEIECVCKEVRQTARKTRDHLNGYSNLELEEQSWSLKDFDIGPAIAKGCSAVVYSAKCLADGFRMMGQQQPTHQKEEFPLAMKMMFVSVLSRDGPSHESARFGSAELVF